MEHKHQAWEIQMLRREVNRHFDLDELVGASVAMQKVFGLIEKVAPAGATVLITGESGVGKELVARAIHARSPRQDKIFLPP
jgi:DNA-binding NtrC family response regulator